VRRGKGEWVVERDRAPHDTNYHLPPGPSTMGGWFRVAGSALRNTTGAERRKGGVAGKLSSLLP